MGRRSHRAAVDTAVREAGKLLAQEKQMKSQVCKTLQAIGVYATAVSVLTLACPLVNWAAAASTSSLDCAQMEEFLRLGTIGVQQAIPKGVTLSRAPRSFRWSYYVGIVEAWSGKNAEGIRDIRGAVKIDGKYGPARVRLGQLLFETGDPDQSLQESVRQNSRLASTSRPGPRAGGA